MPSEWLASQLTEMEMLSSLYTKDELLLDEDCKILVDAKFAEGLVDDPGAIDSDNELIADPLEDLNIGFTLKLSLLDNSKLEVKFQLPHSYPASSKPIVYVCRGAFTTRTAYSTFQRNLNEYIDSLESGDAVLFDIILWIQEENNLYIEKTAAHTESSMEFSNEQHFTRMWIYSHHIYSKFKRRDITNWALELKLHGFSMCGKPGLVCIEGHTSDVEVYWARLRRLNWKRLVMKEREDNTCSSLSEMAGQYRFDVFEEKTFATRPGKGSSQSYHADIGELRKFLEERRCLDMFEMIFGVESRHETGE